MVFKNYFHICVPSSPPRVQATSPNARPSTAGQPRPSLQVAQNHVVMTTHKVISVISKLEVAFADIEKRRPAGRYNLWRAIYAAHRKEVLLSGTYAALESATFVIQPIILRFVLQWLQDEDGTDFRGYGLAAALAFTSFMQAVSHHVLYFETMRMGWNLKVGFIGAVHAKLLRLSTTTLREASAGKVLNLVSTDVLRFDRFSPATHFGWLSPLTVVVVSVLVCYEVGFESGLAGIGVVILAMALQIKLGTGFYKRRQITTKRTDARVSLLSAVLAGMLTVKAYAWEAPFSRAIAAARKLEAASIFKSMTMQAFVSALFFAATPLASLATFGVYWGLGNELKLEVVLPTVALLQVLRALVGKGFARAMQSGPECHVAVLRLQKFLRLPELITPQSSPSTMGGDPSVPYKLSIQKTSWAWPEGPVVEGASIEKPFRLTDINLEVNSGELVIVTGAVGAGKSSLLEAVLGELHVISGEFHINGRAAYAPQKAWIMAGTLRSNILFGRPYDAEYYRKVIQACALVDDIAQLPDGEDTEIGEKGINLSGGQKARVSLARAVYARAELYLIDDPLAAVDPHVAKHLFDEVVCGLLQDSAVLLVTHSLFVLDHPSAKVIHLQEGNATAIDRTAIREVLSSEDAVTEEVEEAQDDTKEKKKKKELSKLVLAEDRTLGQVRSKTYGRYIQYAGVLLTIITMTLFGGGQALLIITDNWLTEWATQSTEDQMRNSNVYIYAILAGSTALIGLMSSLLFFYASNRANSKLHNTAQARVMSAPMSFFSANPAGRILNRLASDQGQIDELLPISLHVTIQLAILVLGSVILVCVAVPWMLIAIPFLLFYMFHVRQFTTKSLRELKRLDGTSRSPVFSAFSASLDGLVCIRAFGQQGDTQKHFVTALETNAKSWFWWLIGNRWIGFRLDCLATAVVTGAVFLGVGLRDYIEPRLLGLALVYSMSLSGMFQFMIRQSALVETLMTSVERVLFYCNKLPIESKGGNAAAPLHWPSHAAVEFEKVSVKYRDDLPEVLKEVSFSVPGGSKVGIVGRTGSGKSSLAQALFRLNDVRGSIRIDGVDTSTIPMEELRNTLSLIPQDPTLFAETLRYNLDPFHDHTDEDIWAALRAVELGNAVNSLGAPVEIRGENFSIGQRQLLSLARAILRNRPIVVMDEATANVDVETDALIQQTIRSSAAFKDKTLFIIAHRMKTIIDCDLIIVLDNGAVAEVGSPKDLLANPTGTFSQMVAKAQDQNS